MDKQQTNFKEGQTEVNTDEVAFQVMPAEDKSTPQEGDFTISPAEENSGSEQPPNYFTRKAIFITVGVLVLLAVIAVAYFMFFKDKGTNQNDPTSSKISGVWLKQHFGEEVCNNQSVCGDSADPDSDGLANDLEFKVRGQTDPKNPDTDGDGLADGDEYNIYHTEPSMAHSFCRTEIGGSACTFDDAINIANGYDPSTPGIKMNQARLDQIDKDIERFKLHEPTQTTLQTIKGQSGNSVQVPQTFAVDIGESSFNPAELTIKRGDTVSWTNKSQTKRKIASDPHPQHSDLPTLISGELILNGTYSFKFDGTGTFGYHDHLNPALKGKVIVK